MRFQNARWFAALAVASFSTVAFAWTQKASLGVKVHGHALHDVELGATDCSFQYKLLFSAPPDGYLSRVAGRNYYVFRARIKLHGGKTVLLPVFGNGGAGERVYERSYDTTAEGCWARTEQKLLGVDVEACRGRGCTPGDLP